MALDAVGRGVVAGLWGTLELGLLRTWLIGVGWLLRREWQRFAGLALVSGVGVVMSSVRTGVTGRTLAEVSGPLDLDLLLVLLGAFGLFFVWLWRGPDGTSAANGHER